MYVLLGLFDFVVNVFVPRQLGVECDAQACDGVNVVDLGSVDEQVKVRIRNFPLSRE